MISTASLTAESVHIISVWVDDFCLMRDSCINSSALIVTIGCFAFSPLSMYSFVLIERSNRESGLILHLKTFSRTMDQSKIQITFDDDN